MRPTRCPPNAACGASSAHGVQAAARGQEQAVSKVPQTDAIFEAVQRINREADADADTIRLSIDTRTAVPIGNLSRGGKSRPAHRASSTIWKQWPS